MAVIKKLLPFIVLAATAALLLVVSPITLAQNETETRYVVNMTGVASLALS